MRTQPDETSSLTGMEAVKEALSRNPQKQRSLSWLASQIGCSRTAPYQWDKIPADRIAEVARVTSLHPRVISPDLAKLFDEGV